MSNRPELRVIRGGRDTGIQIGSIRITPASRAHPPFPVSIQVHAEDIWRVLSTDNRLKDTPEHPVRVATDLIADKPAIPGNILVRGDRWLAIIYDLDQQPICREEWVTSALEKLLRLATEKGVSSMAIPLLGSEHGDLPWQRSLELIARVLHASKTGPAKIWLMVNRLQVDECWKQLQCYSTHISNT